MPIESINGYKIYFEDHGSGDAIVLLHHGFGCLEMWKDIYPALVGAGYRVVLYDRRGYGRSEKGEDFMDFYVSDGFRAAAVRELEGMRKKLGLDNIHLVGQCEGGVVAVDYALDYPNRVNTVSISSTQCYCKTSMPEFNREKFPKAFGELDPDLREKFKRWHGEEHAEPFFELFRTRGGSYGTGSFDLRPLLPSIECPFFVLYPDRSALFDVEQGVSFYRHVQKGELAVLPKCGHNTYEQRPVEYTRGVLEFLERHKHEDSERGDSPLNATCVH